MLTTRHHSQTVVQDWSKAGVMVRGSLAPESGNGFVANTGVNGVRFQACLAGFIASVNDGSALDAVQQRVRRDTPVWHGIERVGDDLNGHYALDEEGTIGWRWAGILRPSPWFRRSSLAWP
ncbi:MAG: hypothetical protein IH892_19910 [Planctomycetes bacterium]|nr:hypothetical protein [Planctomycetota bacterium]